MLKSRDETMCWLAGHVGAVLYVEEMIARVVDARMHADGVSMQAAQSLMRPPRVSWFDVSGDGRRTLLRINAGGVAYHERFVESKKCSCPRPEAGGVAV